MKTINARVEIPEAHKTHPERWMASAVCAQTDPEIFFPAGDMEQAELALNLCRRCPVVDKCRDWGDRTEGARGITLVHGILGGEISTHRVRRRKRTTERGDE